jgi:predicted nucleotidyltransferase
MNLEDQIKMTYFASPVIISFVKYQQSLISKAKFWARIIGTLPGVRAVFLSGSVAQGRGNTSSDIDFFIIAKSGMIWTARFFVFMTLKFFRKMRSNHHHAGQICPNHFVVDTRLEIVEKDAYSAYLFTHNKPLYDPDNIFSHFVFANNDWVQNFDESFPPTVSFPVLSIKKQNFIWHWIEKKLQSAQMKKIKKNPEFQIPGACIVLSDTELRFHPHPRNEFFRR